MKNSKPLEQKMIEALTKANVNSLSAWQLANIIWDGCMTEKRPGNGARIAHLRRCAQKSDKLCYFVSNNDQQCYALAKKN